VKEGFGLAVTVEALDQTAMTQPVRAAEVGVVAGVAVLPVLPAKR